MRTLMVLLIGVEMPAKKPIESRHQTQHKLEVTERYWRAWCRILARANNKGFCNRSLWLVDTMAGEGFHESTADPDGVVPGTPLQAVIAARLTQQQFPGIDVHVRAVDIDGAAIEKLDGVLSSYRGPAPDGVDWRTHPVDWVQAVPGIIDEIRATDHLHPQGLVAHDHRSLWLIDPFGVGPIDRRVIMSLPRGSEVILNFDENAARWHAAKALGGDTAVEALLDRLYGDDRWRAAVNKPLGAFATALAETFATYKSRIPHALRATGSQDRFLIHLTNSGTAVDAFGRAFKAALVTETLFAGNSMSKPQRDLAAKSLHARFRGERLTTREMHQVGGFSLVQLRSICQVADELGYGRWDAASATMTWNVDRDRAGSAERHPEGTLGL